MMNVKSVLSAVLVLCSIGYIKASDNFISFQFSDDDCSGFKASAKYCKGYNCNSTYATNMSDFGGRVSELTKGTLSVASTCRESYNLDSNFRYTVKPNKMGLYEQLKFSGVKCNNGDLNGIVFNGTKEYQPTVVLDFNNEDDANLPNVSCNNIPIVRFNVKNPTDKGVSLRGFATNGVTGLSYNAPLTIDGLKCNNVSCNPRQLSMLASVSDNNNNKINLYAYNNEASDLGTDRFIKIQGISEELAKNNLKIKEIHSYKTMPNHHVDLVINDVIQQRSQNFYDLVKQPGVFVFDFSRTPNSITRQQRVQSIKGTFEKRNDIPDIMNFYKGNNYLEFVIE